MSIRDDIMNAASERRQLRYRLDPPPDGATTTDCSLLVRDSVRAAGAGDLPRTAEQQRQATILVPWQQAKTGDLIFFENTYDAAGPAGPDGKIASHVGFSMGAGTQRMLDARERNGDDVGITDMTAACDEADLRMTGVDLSLSTGPIWNTDRSITVVT